MPEFSLDEISLALFISLPALLLFFRRFGPEQVKDGSSLAHVEFHGKRSVLKGKNHKPFFGLKNHGAVGAGQPMT
ncbi:MAG: hypothetical protein IKN04_03485 [Clostridia bacterium]|nr:hypothetical protein [Clostridia bacterium]